MSLRQKNPRNLTPACSIIIEYCLLESLIDLGIPSPHILMFENAVLYQSPLKK